MHDSDNVVLMIRESGLFDEAWYVREYPDVSALRMEPISHYLQIGWLIGRDPSLKFSTAQYISAYPEVKDKGINPLIHYLTDGRKNGLQPIVVKYNPLAQLAGVAGSQLDFVKSALDQQSHVQTITVTEQLQNTQTLLDTLINRIVDAQSTSASTEEK